MVVGMLAVSVTAGFAAVLAGAALGLPTWVLVALYPTAGALTLGLFAALWSIRAARFQPGAALLALQPGNNARAN
jgi:hypothetical protein